MNEEEDDTVRLDNDARPVWLLKVPPRVARAWDNIKTEDTLVGKLRIHTNEEPVRITFHKEGGGEEEVSFAAAKDFSLNFNENDTPMRVFSKGDGGVEMQGFVEHLFFMQPLQTSQYTSSVSSRVKTASAKLHHTRELDNWEAMRFQPKQRVVKIAEGSNSSSNSAESDAKRRKLNPGEPVVDEKTMRERLFQLFSRKDEEGKRMDYWTMKDIKREINANETQLRNLVKTLCNYHVSGDYARCYELKPEFKSS